MEAWTCVPCFRKCGSNLRVCGESSWFCTAARSPSFGALRVARPSKVTNRPPVREPHTRPIAVVMPGNILIAAFFASWNFLERLFWALVTLQPRRTVVVIIAISLACCAHLAWCASIVAFMHQIHIWLSDTGMAVRVVAVRVVAVRVVAVRVVAVRVVGYNSSGALVNVIVGSCVCEVVAVRRADCDSAPIEAWAAPCADESSATGGARSTGPWTVRCRQAAATSRAITDFGPSGAFEPHDVVMIGALSQVNARGFRASLTRTCVGVAELLHGCQLIRPGRG